MLDKLISWIDHVRTVKKKIAKNIGVKILLKLYFLYIHSYLNYANIAWASTYAMKLKRVYLKQKHAVHIAFNKD